MRKLEKSRIFFTNSDKKLSFLLFLTIFNINFYITTDTTLRMIITYSEQFVFLDTTLQHALKEESKWMSSLLQLELQFSTFTKSATAFPLKAQIPMFKT